ncbi:hypothetical protein [Inquilinus limosus]|uniref:Uncharacterized protein n=1 Tax=Inquilinus limosus MP06 TaxID=1398085 RepID=A0A0A0D9C8_9PROT|nr:hypothetical protein [Inquilinus limosus]KGM35311.1 hypothetical protein P409_05205 [Inquilinus limosus MP06]
MPSLHKLLPAAIPTAMRAEVQISRTNPSLNTSVEIKLDGGSDAERMAGNRTRQPTAFMIRSTTTRRWLRVFKAPTKDGREWLYVGRLGDKRQRPDTVLVFADGSSVPLGALGGHAAPTITDLPMRGEDEEV